MRLFWENNHFSKTNTYHWDILKRSELVESYNSCKLIRPEKLEGIEPLMLRLPKCLEIVSEGKWKNAKDDMQGQNVSEYTDQWMVTLGLSW